ncbi:stage V sporulation protein AB [Metabacillus litoralis]|uniref:Stage V sporulation protein AB n=1 Tax=Metabacillus litoralis TaxID=152268 RepID=A0A5C6W910_9BACI|nr:stage V sporulation protein AB [Metabacillus litoralis]TXC93475.1 stage V sporulation protein AB [Metabacillus litoralis]
MTILSNIILMIVGLSGGLVVGSGFVAFLAVLGIIPRLTQLTKTYRLIHVYEWAIILGAVIVGWMSLRNTELFQSELWLIPIGLLCGVFIGMLAAALTEVLNVFPILAKRIGFGEKIIILLMAIVLGKIVGSLFHWIYFVNQ